jgi:uncharacterized protein
MRRVFLDTVGLLAIWDEADQWHSDAEQAMEALNITVEFFTSDAVLFECGNASARKPYRRAVVELRTELKEAGRVLRPSEDELQAAWDAFDQRQYAGAGIVDQISFILMRRYGLTDVFTNDDHFRAAGFFTLF